MATGERTVVKGVCPLDCPDTCGMLVTVEDGVAVDLRGDLEHPFTRGFLCQKMAHYLDRVYAADRLLHPLRRVGAKGRGPVRADRLGRGPGDDRRAVPRDREVGRRPAGDPAVQLCRDDGQAPGEQPRPAVLPPARGLAARPHHLRDGRVARVRVHPRPRAGSAPTRWRSPRAGSSSTGARTRSSPTATSGAGWSRPASRARRSSPSTRTGARPPRSPTGTSPPAPAPTPRWRSASCTSSAARACRTTTTSTGRRSGPTCSASAP